MNEATARKYRDIITSIVRPRVFLVDRDVWGEPIEGGFAVRVDGSYGFPGRTLSTPDKCESFIRDMVVGS